MQTVIETSFPASSIPASDDEVRLPVCRLGWQCGSAYVGFYPESSEGQQQHAAQSDAETLAIAPEDRPLFLEAWFKGVKAALTRQRTAHASRGVCPCCGQEDAFLSDVMVLIGQASTGQVKLVPQRLCSSCAEVDPEYRFTRSLSRPVQPTAVPYMVLSLLVRKDHPTHLIAEQVASTFPFLTDSLVMHAVEGQVAILVSQVTPTQFTWINRLIAQGFILAVGISLVFPTPPDQCACGHLLRSSSEQQRGWCLECGIEASYSQKGYTQ